METEPTPAPEPEPAPAPEPPADPGGDDSAEGPSESDGA